MKNHLEDEIYFRCTNTTSFLLKIKFSQGEGQDYRQFEDAVDAMLHLKYKIADISELLLHLSPIPSLRGLFNRKVSKRSHKHDVTINDASLE